MKGLPRSLSRGRGIDVPAKKLRLKLNVPLTFTGATGAAVFDTEAISGMEEGNVCIIGAVANLTFRGPTSDDLTNDFQGDFSLGTVATANTTLTGAKVNIIPSTAIAAATAEVSANNRGVLAAPVTLDNTDADLDIHLNVTLDADEVTNLEEVVITVTGTVDILYTVLGDD